VQQVVLDALELLRCRGPERPKNACNSAKKAQIKIIIDSVDRSAVDQTIGAPSDCFAPMERIRPELPLQASGAPLRRRAHCVKVPRSLMPFSPWSEIPGTRDPSRRRDPSLL
jgi:hypothetical protein